MLGFLLGGSHRQLDQAVTCLTCHLSADLTHGIARILDLFGRLSSEKNTSSFGNWTECKLLKHRGSVGFTNGVHRSHEA